MFGNDVLFSPQNTYIFKCLLSLSQTCGGTVSKSNMVKPHPIELPIGGNSAIRFIIKRLSNELLSNFNQIILVQTTLHVRTIDQTRFLGKKKKYDSNFTELLSNSITSYLVPVDSGASKRQLPSQGFEGRVWHHSVVLNYCFLLIKSKRFHEQSKILFTFQN